MKCWKRFQISLALVASCGLLVPHTCVNAQQVTGSTLIQTMDVELTTEGALLGRVVSPAGTAMAEVPVVVSQTGNVVATATTAVDGNFQVAPLRGGMYQLFAAGTMAPVRVWTNRAAPPSSQPSLLLVAGSVERGQSCSTDACTSCTAPGVVGGPLAFLMNPFVIGAAVAAAIAIPLALDDNDKKKAS